MTEDELRWAEALALIKEHGDRTLDYLTGRIAALTEVGDKAGVMRMQAIAVRIDQLTRPGATGQGQPS